MKINKIFSIAIVLGLICAGVIVASRFMTENHYKNYEFTMFFEDVKNIASLKDEPIEESLTEWQDVGINSITLTEASIESLKSDDEFKVTSKLIGSDLEVTATPEGIDFIVNGLKEVLAEDRKIERLADNKILIEGRLSDIIKSQYAHKDYLGTTLTKSDTSRVSKLELVGLGYKKSDIDSILASGFPLEFRPVYEKSLQKPIPSIDRFLSLLDKYSSQSYVVFTAKTALGAGDTKALDYLAKELKDRDIAISLIETGVQREHIEQDGLDYMVRKNEHKAVRIFSTWNYIQRRFDYEIPMHHNGEEISNTFFRAITERNIRVVIFRPFIKNDMLVTDMEVYKVRLNELYAKLAAFPHNFKNIDIKAGERIEIMPELDRSRFLLMFISFAVIAGFMVILDNIINGFKKIKYIVFGLGIALTSLVYILNIKTGTFNVLFAFVGLLVFTTLAVMYVLSTSKEILSENTKRSTSAAFGLGALVLFLSILYSLLGAGILVSYYATSDYLLEMNIFRGVKLSQLLPIFIALVLAIMYFEEDILGRQYDSKKEKFFYLMDMNIKVWHATIAGAALVVLALLIIRSGHETGVQPSSFELLIRNLLENSLPARPRTKAIILGYPAVIGLVMLANKHKYKLAYPVLAMMIAIGQANILNTFSHIRTPLYLSFLRVGMEFISAIIITVIYVMIYKIIELLIKKI